MIPARRVVIARRRQPEQFALLAHTPFWVFRVDPPPLFLNRTCQAFL
jgi:hypothetical protein